jgi:phosphoribosylaminoimidazole-succinocarboxamide synthase
METESLPNDEQNTTPTDETQEQFSQLNPQDVAQKSAEEDSAETIRACPEETSQEANQETAPAAEQRLPDALLTTDLPLPLISQDDDRDIYDLGEYNLAVYTDRMNVFGAPIDGGLPGRGKYMACLASHWLEKTKLFVPNHFKAFIQSSDDLDPYLKEKGSFQLPEDLFGRCLVYKKTQPLDIDFEVWGYLTGPVWKEYQENETVFGHRQINGLLQSQCIPGSVFAAFKTDADGNHRLLSENELKELLGEDFANAVKAAAEKIYYAVQRTLRINGKFIVAHMSMKFERDGNKAVIADDILTPNSACYWDMQHYRVGCLYHSFESQSLTAWLMHTSWKNRGPLPQIPHEIILQTIEKYRLLCERITNK